MNDKQKTYIKQRKKSDNTLDSSKSLIIDILNIDVNDGWTIENTNFYEDTTKCADLKLYNDSECYMFGHRMRLGQYYLEKYPGDMTIRYSNPHGHKTEYIKIMEGTGQYNLYGFFVNGVIRRWILISLINLRKVHFFNEKTGLHEPKDIIKSEIKKNVNDWDNEFMAYDMVSIKKYDDTIPAEERIIVAHSEGYFEDLIIKEGITFTGEQKTTIKLKDKKDRKDGY